MRMAWSVPKNWVLPTRKRLPRPHLIPGQGKMPGDTVTGPPVTMEAGPLTPRAIHLDGKSSTSQRGCPLPSSSQEGHRSSGLPHTKGLQHIRETPHGHQAHVHQVFETLEGSEGRSRRPRPGPQSSCSRMRLGLNHLQAISAPMLSQELRAGDAETLGHWPAPAC